MDQLYTFMQQKRKDMSYMSSACGILWNFPSAQWKVKGRTHNFIFRCLRSFPDHKTGFYTISCLPCGTTFMQRVCIFFLLNEFYFILINGNYFYIDFGRWFFCLDIIDSHLVFCVDSLAIIAAVLVLTLTALALYFGIEYMYREAFINRLLYLLNLFATSVIFFIFLLWLFFSNVCLRMYRSFFSTFS